MFFYSDSLPTPYSCFRRCCFWLKCSCKNWFIRQSKCVPGYTYSYMHIVSTFFLLRHTYVCVILLCVQQLKSISLARLTDRQIAGARLAKGRRRRRNREGKLSRKYVSSSIWSSLRSFLVSSSWISRACSSLPACLLACSLFYCNALRQRTTTTSIIYYLAGWSESFHCFSSRAGLSWARGKSRLTYAAGFLFAGDVRVRINAVLHTF